jgi:hypothetical protein
MYKGNIEERSRNRWCYGKAINITLCAPYYIVICVLSGCAIVFYVIS